MSGGNVAVMEYMVTVLHEGRGNVLVADAERVHEDSARVAWHISIYRIVKGGTVGEKDRVAIMQATSTYSSSPRAVATAPSSDDAPQDLLQPGALDAFLTGRSNEGRGTSAEETRRQIYRGARKVLLRKRYGEATIRDIAAAAGVPIATMYQYIRSKEDLLLIITAESMREALARFERYLVKIDDPAKTLEHIIREYVRYIGENRDDFNLVYREARSLSREKRRLILEFDSRFSSLWKVLIERGVEFGQFDVNNVALVADMVYFFCHIWALRYWNLRSYDEAKIRDALTRYVLLGLAKQPRLQE